MYLKSIEIQGFKSFANKILFEFHNGITGIVGPNGSGKSNVADAVRWVLGEQRAKQLRGESMQDVIFAGTENRKPLSYAYVAITLDNADRQLPVDYEEVTVARRVYRSGESEYLINGTVCRLKDVNELFYDTGIGKEGYSIIGQGQIERILSGRPEERRELFDEAAGIVKFKRRKATAQKKLEQERENLVRVDDILAEQEHQLAPLADQAEKAKMYLNKRDRLKVLDVNFFLLEQERINADTKDLTSRLKLAESELDQAKAKQDKMRLEYEKQEEELEKLQELINIIQEDISNSAMIKSQLEGQINVLREQINSAKLTAEHVDSQRQALDARAKKQEEELKDCQEQYEQAQSKLEENTRALLEAQATFDEVQNSTKELRDRIEAAKKEQLDIISSTAGIQGGTERYDALEQQTNIRKAQLTKRILERKSESGELDEMLAQSEEQCLEIETNINELKSNQKEIEDKRSEWKHKYNEQARLNEQLKESYQKNLSRLESLRNIAERYDGYGNSIRKVMEQKDSTPGLIGVVADLIQVDKRYETAIETALGGGIRNIVTKDEPTAKKMIAFLKQAKAGRATFLPLTSVGKNPRNYNKDVLKEAGVIGRANELVETDEMFKGILEHLIGRTYVIDTLDNAVSIARKYRYTLSIVTLEGESLSPGGSMTGGAFKNNSNLLGRKREIEELENTVEDVRQKLDSGEKRIDDIETARVLLREDLEVIREELQELYLKQNTANINRDRLLEQKNESDKVYRELVSENQGIEQELQEIANKRREIKDNLDIATARQAELTAIIGECEQLERAKAGDIEKTREKVNELNLNLATLRQQVDFAKTNLDRIDSEKQQIELERKALEENVSDSKTDIERKLDEIEELKGQIVEQEAHVELRREELRVNREERDAKSNDQKGFFEKQEQLTEHVTVLDKEVYRLDSQRERLYSSKEEYTNHIWDEYELTPHAALELKDESLNDPQQLRKEISQVRDEIRKLGDVNVNAIEDYRVLGERYEFLKGQHDDLVRAEEALVGIIEELDEGMRRQFNEKFAQIQQEFDKVFKELFGGGKGTLQLVEDEDILESGIRIIAQPPGKKLQNMMQLSGGEKSLTAIALLFAIQNLKPSPFCLLDEIEAALDDSNVTRFAKYLNKLTENTQFIVITHRRGSMNAADRLYGITMQEKGVSTLVSVNLIENDLEK